MKIAVISSQVFVVPLTNYGGLEAIAWESARGLAAKGHDVFLFAPDGSTCPGATVISTGPPGQWDEKKAYGGYWKQLADMEVIIDHSWAKFSYIGKQEGWLTSPVLGVLHAPVSTMYQKPPPVEKPCLVCISHDQARWCMSHLHVPARVAYNGCDPSHYSPLNVPRTNRYLFLARFSSVKGPHIAIESCLKVGAELDLIGDLSIVNEPEYVEKCRRMSDGKQIRFVGPAARGECVWWFSQAKALLHPNRHFCHVPGQKVITAQGSVRIENVREGTMVLATDGKFHTVSKTFARHYDDEIVIIQHSSFMGRVRVTPNHRLFAARPRGCACMGLKSICKPTYGGYQRCKELREITIEKQRKYDMVLAGYEEGASYLDLATKAAISPTTAFYWTRGKTPRPERDLNLPHCDRYTPEWIPAGELAEGDLLVTPVPESIDLEVAVPKTPAGYVQVDGGYRWRSQKKERLLSFPAEVPLTPDFLSFCGWYLAEGYECNGATRFALNRDEVEHAEEIRQQARVVFNRESAIYQAKDSYCQCVIISGKPLGYIMKSWFGGNARIKRMPYWMFMLPPEKLRHVVRSMWRGDGCRCKRAKYEMLSYTTASPSLAQQLWLVLAKLGIISYVVEKISSARAFNAGKIAYNINVSGDSAQKLADIVGWPYKDARSNSAWKGMSYIHNGYIYSRVSNVKRTNYTGLVHNLEVPGPHSYIAQLVGSHNCEPFGLAPVEAQLCGCPVACFDNGAMRETVEHGKTGYLVETEAEFTELLRQDKLSGLDRNHCREWASQFSVQAMVNRYEELCKEAIETGGW